jgi:hypothetical protein
LNGEPALVKIGALQSLVTSDNVGNVKFIKMNEGERYWGYVGSDELEKDLSFYINEKYV